MALEIRIPTSGIRNLIREGKVHQIYGMMQAGKERSGMQTLNESLLAHVLAGRLTPSQALAASSLPEELATLIQRAQATADPAAPPARRLQLVPR